MHIPLTPVTLLERSARAFPQAAAVIQPQGTLSFRMLLLHCRKLAQALASLQIKHGDSVAVFAANGRHTVEAHFGVPGAGAVLVMLNPWLSEVDVVGLIEFSEAKVLIADINLYQRLSQSAHEHLQRIPHVVLISMREEIVPAQCLDYEQCLDAERDNISLEQAVVSENDPIAINFTSGTTGQPKGVIYSHRAGYLHALGQVMMLGLSRQSRYLWTLPMFHVNGWGHMWACVASGCPQIIPTRHLDQEHGAEFERLVREQAVTHLAGAPRLIKAMMEIPELQNNLSGVTIMTGGAAPAPSLIQELERRGVNLIHQYGLSETCGPFVINEPQDDWAAHDSETRARLHARQGMPALHAGTGLQVRDAGGIAVPHDDQTLGEIVMAGNIRQHLPMPRWSVKEKIVLASRILHAQGHDSGLAGQITARVDGAPDFFTQEMGLGLEEIAISNLLRVDAELQVVADKGTLNPANRFHAWIYREQPDVRCIIHTHALHASALSMLGRPLRVAHMDSCALHDDVAYLPAWPGVPVGDNEGELICEALGRKRAVLLAHHGLLVACRTVEEACVLAIQFEHTAKLQLLAGAVGEIQAVNPVLAREAHDWLLHENRVRAAFHYYARKILQKFPECLA